VLRSWSQNCAVSEAESHSGTVMIAMSDFEPDFDPAAFFTLPLAALAVF